MGLLHLAHVTNINLYQGTLVTHAHPIGLHRIDICTNTHNYITNDINTNFVFPQFCSFFHYFHLEMLANVNLDVG